MNPKNWKEYQKYLTTKSLWMTNDSGIFYMPTRKYLPKPSKTFHGVFPAEIPFQFILRFTKKNEIVWDCFGGSGVTKQVSDLLNRKCIINDLNPKKKFIIKADSTNYNPGKNVQLIIMHPPYFDIIKFSNNKNDGSNTDSVEDFLLWFRKVVENVTQYLDKKRFLILVCGNIYKNREEQTIGMWCKDIIREYGFILKSHIIKDYGLFSKGGNRNENLHYFRQLKGNYNKFYGDNVFIMQRVK